MGKNAKRRRLAAMRTKATRATTARSLILSQLAQENELPNRDTRRKLGNPQWYRDEHGR
jgi:hypothetical protein